MQSFANQALATWLDWLMDHFFIKLPMNTIFDGPDADLPTGIGHAVARPVDAHPYLARGKLANTGRNLSNPPLMLRILVLSMISRG